MFFFLLVHTSKLLDKKRTKYIDYVNYSNILACKCLLEKLMLLMYCSKSQKLFQTRELNVIVKILLTSIIFCDTSFIAGTLTTTYHPIRKFLVLLTIT